MRKFVIIAVVVGLVVIVLLLLAMFFAGYVGNVFCRIYYDREEADS